MYYLERRASCKERLIAVELILSACKYQISHLDFSQLGLSSAWKGENIIYLSGFVAAGHWQCCVRCLSEHLTERVSILENLPLQGTPTLP